jgi:hypothetical protein
MVSEEPGVVHQSYRIHGRSMMRGRSQGVSLENQLLRAETHTTFSLYSQLSQE